MPRHPQNNEDRLVTETNSPSTGANLAGGLVSDTNTLIPKDWPQKHLEYKTHKQETIEEIDWELCTERERQWKEDLYATLPKTDAEWLTIFPQTKQLIRSKIAEWRKVADEARKTISEELRKIESLPIEHQSFWRAILKHVNPAVKELAIANYHIKRLRWLLPNKAKSGRLEWEAALERARQADLVTVTKLHGLRLRKSGNTYQSLCPFHTEHTPSFYIYPPSRFCCFGCGEKGDAITFVQKIAGCSFKEAVNKLQNI